MLIPLRDSINSGVDIDLKEFTDRVVSIKCALTALKEFDCECELNDYIIECKGYDGCVGIDTLYYALVLEYKDLCETVGCDVEAYKKAYYKALDEFNSANNNGINLGNEIRRFGE